VHPSGVDGRLAWLSNGQCRYQEALSAAEQGCQYPDELGLGTWSVVELVEAAVRSGRMDKATAAFGRLVEATEGSATDWSRGIVARCRALVTEGADAEPSYRDAIERLGRTGVPMELARAHLLYGEWLRRVGRRVDARRELRAAYEIFDALSVVWFAERAERELLATGEIVRKRSVDTLRKLTPQEAEIAQLAGTGYTNPEIGHKLFISARTVDWHLRKVFTKLDITSRRQLREALPLLARVPVPA